MPERRLRETVEALATSAGRMIGTAAHRAAREHLVQRLKTLDLQGLGEEGFCLPYGRESEGLVNVMARLSGTQPDLAPVLLAAHYDTAGALPGADDNAAAIAILLELAPRLRALKLARPVVFAFFDAEEPPCFLTGRMGSVNWYHNQREGEVHCAVVFDLVGHDVPIPSLEDLCFLTGMESDAELAEVVQECDKIDGLRLVATLNEYIGDLSDHHVFRTEERPYLFLSCGHWEHYHQASDTPEKLNYAKMAAIVELLVELVPRLCERKLAGPFEGYDSTPAELHLMRKHLGPLLQAMGLQLESRADIRSVVGTFMRQFGL